MPTPLLALRGSIVRLKKHRNFNVRHHTLLELYMTVVEPCQMESVLILENFFNELKAGCVAVAEGKCSFALRPSFMLSGKARNDPFSKRQ